MWSMIMRRFIQLTLLPTTTLREQLIFVYVVECVIDLWLWRLHNIIVYAFLLVATFTTRAQRIRKSAARGRAKYGGPPWFGLLAPHWHEGDSQARTFIVHVHEATDPRNRTVAARISVVTY